MSAIHVLLGLPPVAGEVTLANDDRAGPAIPGLTTVDVASCHLGVHGPSAAGGTRFSSLLVRKAVDMTTPALARLWESGVALDELRLHVVREGAASDARGAAPAPEVSFAMKRVRVVHIDWSTPSTEDSPEEHVTFAFDALQVEYRPTTRSGAKAGPEVAAWSVARGQPTYV